LSHDNTIFLTARWTKRRTDGTLFLFNLQPEDMMALSAHLNELSEKHRQLEMRIAEEAARPLTDNVKLSRLKLEKLKLKDEIAKLSQTRH
jgi:hypothetical protein